MEWVQVAARLDGRHPEGGLPEHDPAAVFLRRVVYLLRDDSGLDAGHVTFLTVNEFHGEVVAFRPAHIHTQEHLGPVAAFGAARAGVDVEDCVERVLLVAHHILELQLLHGLHRFGVGLVQFGFGGMIVEAEINDIALVTLDGEEVSSFLQSRRGRTDCHRVTSPSRAVTTRRGVE